MLSLIISKKNIYSLNLNLYKTILKCNILPFDRHLNILNALLYMTFIQDILYVKENVYVFLQESVKIYLLLKNIQIRIGKIRHLSLLFSKGKRKYHNWHLR